MPLYSPEPVSDLRDSTLPFIPSLPSPLALFSLLIKLLEVKGRGFNDINDIKMGVTAGLPCPATPHSDSQGKQAPRANVGDTSCALFLRGLPSSQSLLIKLGWSPGPA